jgi:hypothetical protein
MKISTCLFLGLFLTVALNAKVIYVKKDAAGQNDGSSWADAFQELKAALPTAQFGDEIWVAKGEYRSLVVGDSSFTLVSGVRLLGGFAGWETQAEQRDWAANETVLTGKAAILPAPNVIYCSGTAPGTLIDGFTIRDGSARPPFFFMECEPWELGRRNCFGGGLFLYSGDPAAPTWLTVSNCRFEGNNAYYGGGLAANFHLGGGGLTVKNCFFRNDANIGGGMHLEISNNLPPVPILVDSCVFQGNNASHVAAAVARGSANNVDITFSNCVFRANTANMGGGAMSAGKTMVKQCVFEDNRALHFAGGGGALGGGPLKVESCLFKNNSASNGGAISGGRLEITGSVFVNNRAIKEAGAIRIFGENYLVNNIFIGNFAGTEGGALFHLNAQSDTIVNCIFIGNRAGQSGDWMNQPFIGNIFIDHSYVDAPNCSALVPDPSQPSTFVLSCGEHMFFADTAPMLRDTAAGDYGLLPCSPLVNAGSNAWAERFCGQTDMAGVPRISEGKVDIGAFESWHGFEVAPAGTAPSCPGQPTGTATWAYASGCPPFGYVWSGGAGTGTSASGLSAGAHQFTFTDGRGRVEEATFVVGQTASLSLHTFVVGASASSAQDGSIFTSVTMGLPPYQYLWSTGATTASLTGIAPGAYSLTVTDGAGCEHEYHFEVQYPSSVSDAVPDIGLAFRPNPASEAVEAHWAVGAAPGSRLWLADAAGRVLKSVSVERGARVCALSLEGCPSGVYLLYVTENGKVVARERLVVLSP